MSGCLSVGELKHGYRVGEYAYRMASKLNIDTLQTMNICIAANYHDIGKLCIDTRILEKKTTLTETEYNIIKKHAFYGSKILDKFYINYEIINNVLYHHENYDGTGYYGLSSDEIPLGARVIRICDVFDALTSERPYKKSISTERAISIMINEKEYFDNELFYMFLRYCI